MSQILQDIEAAKFITDPDGPVRRVIEFAKAAHAALSEIVKDAPDLVKTISATDPHDAARFTTHYLLAEFARAALEQGEGQ